MKTRHGSDSKTLITETQKIIEEFKMKMTLRQVYYQLVSKHLIENVISQYKRLSRILVKARHEGEIDWEDIEDRTRQSTGGDDKEETPESHFQTAFDYLKECYKYYNLPKWKSQPKYVEVWFEKQALEGVFEVITRDWKVVQLACKGYSSHTMGYELKKRIDSLDGDKEVHIIYFGDFDASGLDIYRFIQKMCERFNLTIKFERVALTKKQIKQYKLPPMMAKSSDSRYAKFVADYGVDVVELDALRPDILQQMINEAIEKRFDNDIWEDIQNIQEQERKRIERMVKKVLK